MGDGFDFGAWQERGFWSGPLLIDSLLGEVKLDNEFVKLTPTEYSLLDLLASNTGGLMTHQDPLAWRMGPGVLGRHLKAKGTHPVPLGEAAR